jgi:hypothetical protein
MPSNTRVRGSVHDGRANPADLPRDEGDMSIKGDPNEGVARAKGRLKSATGTHGWENIPDIHGTDGAPPERGPEWGIP